MVFNGRTIDLKGLQFPVCELSLGWCWFQSHPNMMVNGTNKLGAKKTKASLGQPP
jgi:hypothetical protein